MRSLRFWRDEAPTGVSRILVGTPLLALGIASLTLIACDTYYDQPEPIPGCFVDEDCGPHGLCDTRGCPLGPQCYLDYCEDPPPCLGQCVAIGGYGGGGSDPCKGLDQQSCMKNDQCQPIYSTDGCSNGAVDPGGSTSRCSAPSYDHCENVNPPPGPDGGPTGDGGTTPTGDGGVPTGDGGTTSCPPGQILFNGQCQDKPGTGDNCSSLDLTNCIATGSCEVVSDGGGAYHCSGATGRACEGLDELECQSREDCGVVAGSDGNFGSCVTPAAPDPCTAPTLTGGTCTGDNGTSCSQDLCADQCAMQDEAGCLAAHGLCKTYYAGAQCTCETNDNCMCQDLTFSSCVSAR
jgi:hypothetical protein